MTAAVFTEAQQGQRRTALKRPRTPLGCRSAYTPSEALR